MNTRSRPWRILVTIWFALLAYLIYLPTRTGPRAKTDEAANTLGTIEIIDQGSFSGGYISGHVYELLLGPLLQITGLPFEATNWLSPLVALAPLMAIVIVGAALLRRNGTDMWWVILLIAPAILAVPEIFDGTRETSHKAFTYAMSFIVLYVMLYFPRERIGTARSLGIVSVLSLTLVLLNYPWAVIFLGAVSVGFIVHAKLSDDFSSVTWMLPVAVSVLTSILFLPGIAYQHIASFIPAIVGGVGEFLLRSGGGNAPSAGNSDGILELIGQYPTLDILGVSINFWFVYSIGVVLVGLICVIAALYALHDLVSSESPNPLSTVFVIVSIAYAVLLVAAVASGTSVIVKRMIVWPVLLGLLYWVLLLGSPGMAVGWLSHNRSKIAVVSITLLIVSVPFAAERYAPTSPNASHNPHLSVEEEAVVAFAATYASDTESATLHRDEQAQYMSKLYRMSLPSGDCLETSDRIYASDNSSPCEATVTITPSVS